MKTAVLIQQRRMRTQHSATGQRLNGGGCCCSSQQANDRQAAETQVEHSSSTLPSLQKEYYQHLLTHLIIQELEDMFKGCLGQGVSYIYSDTICGIYRAFYPWCEFFIKFCSAIAEILQHTGAQQCRYGKPKFRESL